MDVQTGRPQPLRTGQSWYLDDIDFSAVNIGRVTNDRTLFATLASASFVEIFSQKYAANLIQLFARDTQLTRWLTQQWQRDEVRHGEALKRYVQTAWPDFDWEAAYRRFEQEYSALCSVAQLESRLPLELIARCVVETGTSSFYRALQSYVDETVLLQILERIRCDEIAHFSHFRHSFIEYNRQQRQSVPDILRTIWRRIREIDNEDAFIAFKSVQTDPAMTPEQLMSRWHEYRRSIKRLARRHYPTRQAVKMLISPIPMTSTLKQLLLWPVFGMAVLFAYS